METTFCIESSELADLCLGRPKPINKKGDHGANELSQDQGYRGKRIPTRPTSVVRIISTVRCLNFKGPERSLSKNGCMYDSGGAIT